MSGAAWEIEKDVLYPGRVVVPDPTRPGRHLAYTFTRRDAERMAATGNAQLRDGWHTPVAWEHQNVEPVRLSQAAKDREYALSCFGHAAAYRVDPADGRVRVVLRGDDPADLEQFKKLKFVSPEIQWDWTDSDGKTWHGPTITHIAATARPVQRHQHPVGARLSLRGSNPCEIQSFQNFVTALRVDPKLGASTGPGGRLRLSLTDYEAPMADTLDFGGGAGTGGDKASAWERIAKALEGAGIRIGDAWKGIKDPDHLADLIEVACLNSPASDDLADDDMAGLDDEPDPNAPPGDVTNPPPGADAPPPPIQMSLRKQQTQAEGFARSNLAHRIDALETARRITPAIAADLRRQVPTVRLSFAANADLKPNDLTVRLDAYEQLPEGAAWSPADRRAAGKRGARLSHRGAAVPRPAYEGRDDDGVDPAVLKEQERLAATYSVGATK